MKEELENLKCHCNVLHSDVAEKQEIIAKVTICVKLVVNEFMQVLCINFVLENYWFFLCCNFYSGSTKFLNKGFFFNSLLSVHVVGIVLNSHQNKSLRSWLENGPIVKLFLNFSSFFFPVERRIGQSQRSYGIFIERKGIFYFNVVFCLDHTFLLKLRPCQYHIEGNAQKNPNAYKYISYIDIRH